MLLGELWLTAVDIPAIPDGLSAVILIHHNHGQNIAEIRRVKICHHNDSGFYFDQYLKQYCYYASNMYCIRVSLYYSVARFLSLDHLKPCRTKDAAFFVPNTEYYARVSQAVTDYLTAGRGDTVERVWHE